MTYDYKILYNIYSAWKGLVEESTCKGLQIKMPATLKDPKIVTVQETSSLNRNIAGYPNDI